MTARHLVLLVEEPSMEAFLRTLLPRLLPTGRTFEVHHPDAIRGGTWEVFERVLKQHGYFTTGLRKVEAARALAAHFEPERNRSRSFARLHEAVAEAMA